MTNNANANANANMEKLIELFEQNGIHDYDVNELLLKKLNEKMYKSTYNSNNIKQRINEEIMALEPLLLSQYRSPIFFNRIKEKLKSTSDLYCYNLSDNAIKNEFEVVLNLIKDSNIRRNSSHHGQIIYNPVATKGKTATINTGRESSHIGGGKKNKKKNRKIKKRSNKKRSYSKIKNRVNKS